MSLTLCFTARRLVPYKTPDSKKSKDNDIIQYVRKNKVTKVGDGENDYVIEEVVVEDSRCNRQAYIASHADDVGVMNILKKVRLSGDLSLINQTHSVITEELQDYTKSPENIGEALRSVQSGANSFEGLKAIFGDTSFEQLAKMSADDIKQYLNAFVEANTPKKQETEKGDK